VLVVCAAGSSKQYGFVEFSLTLDEVKKICHQLNRKMLQSGATILCDVMSASVDDFEQLRASCLCVKNLSADFTDDDLLQKKFSVIAKPLFCRVSQGSFNVCCDIDYKHYMCSKHWKCSIFCSLNFTFF